MRTRRIYFDADGVLVDFNKHYTDCFHSNPITDSRHLKWDVNIIGHGSFFLDLPKMDGIDDLWDMVPDELKYILSAVAKEVPDCAEHKVISIKKHFDIEDYHIILVQNKKDKPQHCQPGDILIDDRADNIQQWVDAGGIGILFESVEQAMVTLWLIMVQEGIE